MLATHITTNELRLQTALQSRLVVIHGDCVVHMHGSHISSNFVYEFMVVPGAKVTLCCHGNDTIDDSNEDKQLPAGRTTVVCTKGGFLTCCLTPPKTAKVSKSPPVEAVTADK